MKKCLLHTCCAPCLTSVFDLLKNDYQVTIFWYNPNIHPLKEYEKRLEEVKRYAKIIKADFIDGNILENQYNFWKQMTSGFENESESGKRCKLCIDMRLEKTAEFAKLNSFNHFATTLTVSPHKNAEMINKIGNILAQKYNIDFLKRDFKKNDGYLRSIELCKEYNIYRQKYCGCEYSVNA